MSLISSQDKNAIYSPKRVVIIWHAAVKVEYRELVLSLVRQNPTTSKEVKNSTHYYLITPKRWPEGSAKSIKAYQISADKLNLAENHKPYYHHLTLTTIGNGMSLHFYPMLFYHLNRIKPDLIDVVEDADALVCHQARLYAKKHGIPYLFNSALNTFSPNSKPHNGDDNRFLKNFIRFIKSPKNFLLQSIEKQTYQSVAAAIFRNPSSHVCHQQKGFNRPYIFIGNGVKVKSQMNANKKDNKQVNVKSDKNFIRLQKKIISLVSTKSNVKIIGFIGRLRQEKGIFRLIDALAMLLERTANGNEVMPSFYLLVMGSGSVAEQKKVRLSLQAKLAHHHIWGGYVAGEHLVACYRWMHFLAVPSEKTPTWEEPFGRVVIEAQSVGCIVMGSTSGHIPALIRDKSLLFKAGDNEDLMSKLTALLSHLDKKDAVARYQKLGKKWASEYDWNTLAVKRKQFYRQVVSGKW